MSALRVRGVVHPIADQAGIVGWHRIVMILYKPTAQYLIDVLQRYLDDETEPVSSDENPFQQIEPGETAPGPEDDAAGKTNTSLSLLIGGGDFQFLLYPFPVLVQLRGARLTCAPRN